MCLLSLLPTAFSIEITWEMEDGDNSSQAVMIFASIPGHCEAWSLSRAPAQGQPNKIIGGFQVCTARYPLI